jgi:hypothetical protein
MHGLLDCCPSLDIPLRQLHSGIQPRAVVFPPTRQRMRFDVTLPRSATSSRRRETNFSVRLPIAELRNPI